MAGRISAASPLRRSQKAKVFGSFLQKRTFLPSSPTGQPEPQYQRALKATFTLAPYPKCVRLLRRTFQAADAERAPAGLRDFVTPGIWGVEAGCDPPKTHRPGRLLARLRLPQRMAISLSTSTMLPLRFGEMVADRIGATGCVIDGLAGLALHEMLVNAAIHGNLQIATGRAALWHDLASREVLIAAALDDARLAVRVVTTAIGWDAHRVCVAIIDQGPGYTPTPASVSARRAGGRGLLIARAAARVDVLCGGCCTRLTFARVTAPLGEGKA